MATVSELAQTGQLETCFGEQRRRDEGITVGDEVVIELMPYPRVLPEGYMERLSEDAMHVDSALNKAAAYSYARDPEMMLRGLSPHTRMITEARFAGMDEWEVYSHLEKQSTFRRIDALVGEDRETGELKPTFVELNANSVQGQHYYTAARKLYLEAYPDMDEAQIPDLIKNMYEWYMAMSETHLDEKPDGEPVKVALVAGHDDDVWMTELKLVAQQLNAHSQENGGAEMEFIFADDTQLAVSGDDLVVNCSDEGDTWQEKPDIFWRGWGYQYPSDEIAEVVAQGLPDQYIANGSETVIAARKFLFDTLHDADFQDRYLSQEEIDAIHCCVPYTKRFGSVEDAIADLQGKIADGTANDYVYKPDPASHADGVVFGSIEDNNGLVTEDDLYSRMRDAVASIGNDAVYLVQARAWPYAPSIPSWYLNGTGVVEKDTYADANPYVINHGNGRRSVGAVVSRQKESHPINVAPEDDTLEGGMLSIAISDLALLKAA